MTTPSEIIAARREAVTQSYNSALAENRLRFLEGDDKATAEYIFPNQREDAFNVVDIFYRNKRRVVSIPKKTKVGADGLMIEIAMRMTTHNDDGFVVNPANVRFITGMSNAGWEKDMIEKAPGCFKDKIFHHGKLQKADLLDIKDGFIIIDEIDTGDKEYQVLHRTLKDARILDIDYMVEHNIRVVFITATMLRELYALYQWGELHELYRMTIPAAYIGHKEFLDRGIVKEFFAVNTVTKAEKWIQEDILDHYGSDYRIHIVRVNMKNIDAIQDACIRKHVHFRNHTSTDRLTEEEITEFFKEPLPHHIVLGVKGFFRRANLIPNRWKLRIGATHELWTKVVDNNVQVQGLTGRMTGYWRADIEGGHKTGPHRTSISAITEYEESYADPFGKNSYQTSGFKKSKNGKTSSSTPTMLSPEHIVGLQAVPLPHVEEDEDALSNFRVYADENVVRDVCKFLNYRYTAAKSDTDGFRKTTLNAGAIIASVSDAIKKVRSGYGGGGGVRTHYPCYIDTADNSTLRFVVIIRPGSEEKMDECDTLYPPLSAPYS